MTLKFYFLRHGETEFSQSGAHCGAIEADLTPARIAMAQAFATAYQDVAWAAIYCSPMRRTQATAAPIAAATGITPQLRDGLKEIFYGDWEGQTKAAVQSQFGADYDRWIAEPAWNPPTGGETTIAIAQRAMAVIAEITTQHHDGNILVVSHKATLRIILCSLLGIDLGRYRDRLDYATGAVSVVSIGRYGPMLESINDRSYLPPELRERSGT
jgi:broad specificity phosphatase PhoE